MYDAFSYQNLFIIPCQIVPTTCLVNANSLIINANAAANIYSCISRPL